MTVSEIKKAEVELYTILRSTKGNIHIEIHQERRYTWVIFIISTIEIHMYAKSPISPKII